MKKLKMIVTSVVVLAIVGSAFAFKSTNRTFKYCVSEIAANSSCYIASALIRDEVNGNTSLFYDTNFDGTHCSSTVCPTLSKFKGN